MSVSIDERISARRQEVREDRRRGRLRRTLTVLTLLILVAVGAYVERSDLVALTEVRVVGAVRLQPDDIREAAALPLGTSTLRLRLRSATDRVTALPLVASATARRIDPLTVEITVTERTPVLVAVTRTSAVLVDAEGVVIANGSEPELLQVAAPVPLPVPGEHVSVSPALANAHAIHVALPGPIRAMVVRYDAVGDEDLDLFLDGDDAEVRVRFGRADRIDEKARALGAIIEDLGPTPVSLIDVRAPTNPVVRR